MSDRKLLVAFPIYRNVPAGFFSNWLSMDKGPVAATVTIDGAYLPLGLTQMVEVGLADFGGWDRLVLFEQDMIPPEDALLRVAGYGDEFDIVGSMYFMHVLYA